MKLLFCVVLSLLLVSCGWLEPPEDGRSFDTETLSKVVNANFVLPVVTYPDTNQPKVMAEVAAGSLEREAGNYPVAIRHYEEAASAVQQLDGTYSTMLLPIYDQLILTHIHAGDIESADRLQHAYQRIVKKRFSNDEVIMRNAAFRLGCWHGLSGDWYEAMFDFEEVIRSFEKDDALIRKDAEQLTHAEDLADLASHICTPNW